MVVVVVDCIQKEKNVRHFCLQVVDNRLYYKKEEEEEQQQVSVDLFKTKALILCLSVTKEFEDQLA